MVCVAAEGHLIPRSHGLVAQGLPCFTRQLSRFSTPEELFGPLSLAALRTDRYVRQSAGFLPDAGLAMIDEVFKGSSALLNLML